LMYPRLLKLQDKGRTLLMYPRLLKLQDKDNNLGDNRYDDYVFEIIQTMLIPIRSEVISLLLLYNIFLVR
jgi:hypothetical protein